MTNGEKFRSLFGVSAEELWCTNCDTFTDWLNEDLLKEKIHVANVKSLIVTGVNMNIDTDNNSELIDRRLAIELVMSVCDSIMSGCGSHYDGDDEVYDDIKEVNAILKCNKEIKIALRNMPVYRRDE